MAASAAVAAATVIGGMMASDAASDASSAQQQSAKEAAAVQQNAINQQYMMQMQSREDMRPWMETGQSALNRLAYLTGIGGLSTGRQMTEAQIREELLPQFTRQNDAVVNRGYAEAPPSPAPDAVYTVDPLTGRWGWRYYETTGDSGGGTNPLWRYADEPYFDQLTGRWYGQEGQTGGPGVATPGQQSSISVDEEGLNAAIQKRLAEQQAALEQAQADPEYGSLLRAMTGEDYRNDAVRQELERLNLYGPFSLEKFQEDPGFQFRQQQGEQAINRAAAAAGRYDSGRALKDLTAFNSGLASQEYGNAFSRYYTDQGAISDIYNQAFDRDNITRGNSFNRLAQMAGLGQNAAGQMGTMGQAYGSMLGNNANAMSSLALAGGNSAAAGIVGSANAWGNTLGGLANLAGDYLAKNNQGSNNNSPSRVTSYGLRWS